MRDDEATRESLRQKKMAPIQYEQAVMVAHEAVLAAQRNITDENFTCRQAEGIDRNVDAHKTEEERLGQVKDEARQAAAMSGKRERVLDGTVYSPSITRPAMTAAIR